MGTSEERHLLFVVGMHRSGTSAVCAALQASGAVFGQGLLAPMANVNDRGFWEAESVVALNEELLRLAGTSWYGLDGSCVFSGSEYSACSTSAQELLSAGFGEGPVEAVKDPRFCLTLPFWLRACEALGLNASVCVVRRHPVAVARSLDARDGLPPGYGLRLAALYERAMSNAVPPGSPVVSFEALVDDPAQALGGLFETLPLAVDASAVSEAVDKGLRHHDETGSTADAEFEWGTIGSDEFDAQVEHRFPLPQTMAELADRFDRGQEMTRVGELHSSALATIEERDAQLEQAQAEKQNIGQQHSQALETIAAKDEQIKDLAALYEEASALGDQHAHALAVIEERDEQHAQALAVIEERDEQIREFDRRLSDLGQMHSDALARINQLESELGFVKGLPFIGLIKRVLGRRAQR